VLKAEFFDLFRTLGEFKGKVNDVEVYKLLQRCGYEIYPQTFHHAFSFVTFIDNPHIGFTNYLDMFQKTFERIGLAVDEATIRDVSQLYANNPFKLYSGSSTAVRRVKCLGLKTAIVTTPPRFWFETGIEPILNDIDFICTSSETGCEKSNPRIYLKALLTLGVTALETVVIGDDPELDICIPKRMGMKTIHLTTGDIFSEADVVARNIREAVDIVERWFRNGAPAGI
jgi:HAD superfamily hydrolase (TIGR01549 family)